MKQQWDPVRIQCSCWKVVQNITSCYMWQLRLSFLVVSYRLFWAKLGLWRIQNSDKFRFIWRNTVNSIENVDMADWEILLQTITALESASNLSLLPSLSLLSLAMAEIGFKRESYLNHISSIMVKLCLKLGRYPDVAKKNRIITKFCWKSKKPSLKISEKEFSLTFTCDIESGRRRESIRFRTVCKTKTNLSRDLPRSRLFTLRTVTGLSKRLFESNWKL